MPIGMLASLSSMARAARFARAGTSNTSARSMPPSDCDDAGPLCLLRYNRQLSTNKLVRPPGREDLAEMAVSAGSWESAPLEPVHCAPKVSPFASGPNCPSLHHCERGSPMKNRKREICTSGSARDEDGQPPHLLGRRNFLHLAAGAVALPVVSRIAIAQVYPNRPVRIVVPVSPGGALDILARLIGQWLTERLGQPFVIENRPGAGTNIGVEVVVRAPADGYTLLLIPQSVTTNATLYEKLGFNFIRDIVPIAMISSLPLVMEVAPSVPAKTVPEFIAYVKSNPGTISMASGGSGSMSHVGGELVKLMTHVDMLHVPYRGGAPALTDLIGGQVQVMFSPLPESIEAIKAGKVRALAVTTATRSRALPEVPTVAECVPGFEASTWQGIGAPKNTSGEIVDRLNKEINAALADPKINGRLADLGSVPMPMSPSDFEKLIAAETERWAKVIHEAKIKLQ